ncbi:helix-turn-helix transcriptional regulator [Massilia sp. METH4]|uniref:helix-turn-helix domain-containing protein n=1 Tax=Massilia sp. METH4 TaxID=3123041 RepID=UPI0030CB19EA
MRAFYTKALLRLVLLLGASILLGYLCVARSYHREPLFGQEDFGWQLHNWHNSSDGTTRLDAKVETGRLIMEFSLSGSNSFPNASTALFFTDRQGKPKMRDWTGFDKLSFEARCFPANTIRIALPSFDDKLSKPGDMLTYRTPAAFVDCDPDGARIELDLARLAVPQWWIDMHKLKPSDMGYSLAKVAQIEFGTSTRSQAGTPSRVEIAAIELHDREYGYLYFLGAFLAVAWGGFGFWFFRQYAAALASDLRARMQKDLPLVAYQQLAIEPHREKEKSALLKLLATRYADSELDLETVVSQTGINRNKVNEILKAEMGYTFTGYLNKLRLTEAARLLVENGSASIAEIAYSVGYKNSSYFNKLFKEEYQCTPKAFREVCKKEAQAPAA